MEEEGKPELVKCFTRVLEVYAKKAGKKEEKNSTKDVSDELA